MISGSLLGMNGPRRCGEILSQDVEFITDFIGLLTITAGSRPHLSVLHLANLIAVSAAMYFKGQFRGLGRPRSARRCAHRSPYPGTHRFPAATPRRPT